MCLTWSVGYLLSSAAAPLAGLSLAGLSLGRPGTGGTIGDGGVAGETLVAIGPSELMRALKRAEGARTGEVIGEPDDELVTSVVTRFYRSAKLMDFTLSWVFPAI